MSIIRNRLIANKIVLNLIEVTKIALLRINRWIINWINCLIKITRRIIKNSERKVGVVIVN